jgi:predicted transcriptional regulator
MRKLTATQREVLETLVRLYEKEKRSIKSKEIATILNKDEGTVRNIIAWLKGMGLIESLTGPSGGYVPTLKAYDVIKGTSGQVEEYGYGILTAGDDGSRYRFIARSLEIMGLLTGGPVRAVIKILGDLNRLKEGDRVKLESLLWRKLVLEGVVRRRNVSAGELLIEVDKLVAIPDEYVL